MYNYIYLQVGGLFGVMEAVESSAGLIGPTLGKFILTTLINIGIYFTTKIYMFTCIHTYIYIFSYLCIYICIFASIDIYIHVRIYFIFLFYKHYHF
jgi:hypothetical protein